jgi:bacillopeptidase F (M6 metalloprotease family)
VPGLAGANRYGGVMTSPLKLSIRTKATGEPVGYDSSIISVPAGWYATVGGERALLAQVAGKFLRRLSEQQAAGLGEKLHHAVWTITGDPAEVRTLGLMHNCPTCRAGVDQALVHQNAHPGAEVAVGQLWWAA